MNGGVLLWIAVYDQRTHYIQKMALLCLFGTVLLEQFYTLIKGSKTIGQVGVQCCISIVYFLVFLLLSHISGEQFGMGDVKLIGIQAMRYSWMTYLLILATAFFLCSLYVFVGMVFRRWKKKDTVAFVPFLAGSIGLYMLL